jgi:uroporphyrin-III C-methyltransferase
MNTPTAPATGRVYLVGAGPGDPELLTLRAARLLASADVLVYDNLVSDGVLALANPKAERIYAGKRRNEHTLRQEQINALLVQLAQAGKQVVRLKGGDPFIFGRGGEEMQKLTEQSVPFEVVPGITAASGVACYAGIPLTHRDHAQSCLFVTGHLKDGNPELEWAALVRAQQTVVIYMGLSALPEICKQLIAHGAPPARPIALVQHGTLATQRVLTGTLSTLPDLVAGSGFSSPSLLIVGDVVQLHGTLDWFDTHQGAQTRLTHDEAAQLPPLPISGEKT